jgi:ornithine decarboxylase
MLAALGAGFDCASVAELAAVLDLGVARDRIIYAHPCKPPSQVGQRLPQLGTQGAKQKV